MAAPPETLIPPQKTPGLSVAPFEGLIGEPVPLH